MFRVTRSMFFLAHLLGAYAIHVPVVSSVVWCKPLKIFFSKTAQQNSYILHTYIKVCSNGGATYIIGEIIAKDNLNIENLMQTFENLLLQTCTFTKWKLILSNNEDNINSWICFTFLNVFSVKCSEFHVRCSLKLTCGGLCMYPWRCLSYVVCRLCPP